MMVPHQLLFSLAVVGVSFALAHQGFIEPRHPEAEVLGVEPTKNAVMGAAQDQPSTRDQYAPDLGHQRRPLLLRHVLDNLDAGYALKPLIGKGKLESITLADLDIRKLCLGDF